MKLVGHQKQLRLLEGALEKDHLPHTLLFSGPQGVGKRIVALTLAEKILGANRSTKTSEMFWRGEHPDLHLIGLEEEKKDISVEQARDFITSLQLRPYLGLRRVAIIDDAHLLSIAASNSLLLTLEEPPNDCFIILVTHSPQRLLPTILSRSQEMSFSELTRTQMEEIFSMLGCSNELTKTLLEFSDSSMEIFDLAPFREGYFNSNQTKTVKQLQKATPEIENLIAKIQQALETTNPAELLSLAADLGDKENSTEMVFRLLIKNLREKAVSSPSLAHTSEALLRLIQLEKATRTRNLNPITQLSNFFVQNFAQ
jgi:DNA polymerase III delta prime subunit